MYETERTPILPTIDTDIMILYWPSASLIESIIVTVFEIELNAHAIMK